MLRQGQKIQKKKDDFKLVSMENMLSKMFIDEFMPSINSEILNSTTTVEGMKDYSGDLNTLNTTLNAMKSQLNTIDKTVESSYGDVSNILNKYKDTSKTDQQLADQLYADFTATGSNTSFKKWFGNGDTDIQNNLNAIKNNLTTLDTNYNAFNESLNSDVAKARQTNEYKEIKANIANLEAPSKNDEYLEKHLDDVKIKLKGTTIHYVGVSAIGVVVFYLLYKYMRRPNIPQILPSGV